MCQFIIVFLCIILIAQFFNTWQTKNNIRKISDALDEIADGNLDRRLLADEGSELGEVIYKINEIVIRDKNKLLKAEQSNNAYKKMVTSLSHDIRTPLASLIGYLGVLREGNVSPEEQDSFLEITEKKALHLSEYIQSLFEWLKLESGEWTYQFEELNLCETTRILLADWIMKLEDCGIQYQFDIPEQGIFLVTDKKAYERVLNNILANVIRHSGADFLSVSLTVKETKTMIEISDNGAGICDEDLPFIFDRLYQCDNSRSGNSNGLGLSIAKELITAIKGSVSVESKEKEGTTFTIELPRSRKK